MKNVKIVLFAAVILLTINSCKKNNGGGASWSATINGAGLTNSKQSGTTAATDASLLGNTVLTLTMYPSGTAYPSLSILGTNTAAITPGTYPLYGSGIFNATYTLANSTQYNSTSGSLVISAISTSSTSVSGTFTITLANTANASDTVVITGGTFTDGSMVVN